MVNASSSGRIKTQSEILRHLKKEWPLHLMMIVPVAFLIVFSYIPMGGILMAFQRYIPAKGILGSKWVGGQNFQLLFSMPGFRQSIINTIIIAFAKIVLGVVVPVVFSLMLNEMQALKLKRSIQTVIYMPHFISWVLMAGIIIRLLSVSGVVNQMLQALGYERVIFLAKKEWFRGIIILTDLWKEFGYGTIVYLAAIAGVNVSLYEAATMDGAGHWRQMWHVTLPGIAPTIVLMATLNLGNILNAGFDQIFNLYSPVVYETGDIIDTFVYRMAFENGQFSVSTAAGLFKSMISCLMIILSYRVAYVTTGYRVF